MHPYPRFSISRTQAFKECSQRHHLLYRQGLRYRNLKSWRAELGSAVHKMLAHGFTQKFHSEKPLSQKDMADILESYRDSMIAELNAQPLFVEIPDLSLVEIPVADDAKEYDAWMIWTVAYDIIETLIYDDQLFDKYTPLADKDGVPLIEWYIDYPLDDLGIKITGFIDMIAVDEEGHKVLIDWKTRAAFQTYEAEILNSQLAVYAYVAQQLLGFDLGRLYLIQIKSARPMRPLQVMSRENPKTGIRRFALRPITTTQRIYRETLLNMGEDPDDPYYEEFIPKLATSWANIISLPIYNKSYLINVYTAFMTTVMKIMEEDEWVTQFEEQGHWLDNYILPRAYGFMCKGCPFQEACRLQVLDYPVDAVEEFLDTYFEIGYNNETDSDGKGDHHVTAANPN